jgi:signal transduction histidine kinase
MRYFIDSICKKVVRDLGKRFLFSLFLLPALPASSQISEHLYKSLPDSIRPQDPRHLTTGEVKRILDNTFLIKSLTSKEIAEADSICLRFASKYINIKTEPARRDYLFSVCQYLSQGINYHAGRYSLRGNGRLYQYPFIKFAMQYSDLFIDLYGEGLYFDAGKLTQILSNKANFYVQSDGFKDAYDTHISALEVGKKFVKSSVPAKYVQLARFFEYFDRPYQTLAYCDSASKTLVSLETVPRRPSLEGFLIRVRQIANFSLYLDKYDEKFANEIKALHNSALALRPRQERYLSVSYTLLAGLAYYDKQYKRSLAYLDSAETTFPQTELLDVWEMNLVYKGLSLRHLKRFQESNDVFSKLDLDDIKKPVVAEVLNTLYEEELASGNFQRALQHRERLFKLHEKKHKMDLEGKALEMEQLFKIRQKEQEISQLNALQNRNKTIFGFAVLIVALIIINFISIYRRSVFKTQSLIKQLETTTQLQVMHLELARQEERKLLGQDLHNGFSSALAGVKHQLDLAIMDAVSKSDQELLNRISHQVSDIYEMSRSTSHNWYHGFENNSEKSFAVQIQNLADSALPDTSYNKSILVEDNELSGMNLQLRIDLLRITQELLTNIVKHAKARSVTILVCKDLDFLILNIIDDGVGFNLEKAQSASKGIGLRSLREKLQKLNGVMQVATTKKGTDILIKIPFAD